MSALFCFKYDGPHPTMLKVAIIEGGNGKSTPGQVLLKRRDNGNWTLPRGSWDPADSIQAALREVIRQEFLVEIPTIEICGVKVEQNVHIVAFYICKVGDEVTAPPGFQLFTTKAPKLREEPEKKWSCVSGYREEAAVSNLEEDHVVFLEAFLQSLQNPLQWNKRNLFLIHNSLFIILLSCPLPARHLNI